MRAISLALGLAVLAWAPLAHAAVAPELPAPVLTGAPALPAAIARVPLEAPTEVPLDLFATLSAAARPLVRPAVAPMAPSQAPPPLTRETLTTPPGARWTPPPPPAPGVAAYPPDAPADAPPARSHAPPARPDERGAVEARAQATPAPQAPPAPPRALAGVGIAVVAFALYHQLRGDGVAAQATRRRILDVLASRPGLGATELASALGLDISSVSYHVRRLADERLIVAEASSRRPRWFAAGGAAPDERARLVAARLSGDVLQAVREVPGECKTTLAAQLAISRTAVGWHLSRLERAGLVRSERAGRRVLVYPITFS